MYCARFLKLHVCGFYSCSCEGLFAVLRGWAAHVSFEICKPRAARTGTDMTASRAYRQVSSGDGTDFVELFGVKPDIHEFLVAYIAAGQWKLNAGVDGAVR